MSRGRYAVAIEPEPYEYWLWTGKTCIACGRSLPANADFFRVDRNSADGLKGRCRGCANARERERRPARRAES